MKNKNIFIIEIALLLITVIAVFSVIANYETEPKAIEINLVKNPKFGMDSSSEAASSLSTYIGISTDCFIGKFVSCKNYDEVTEYEFSVTEKIFGNSEDTTVRVRIQNYGNRTDGDITPDSFTIGHEYLLLVRKDETLFLEYPRYSLMGHIVMDFSDINNSKWEEGTIKITTNTNKNDVVNHIKLLVEETGIAVTKDDKMFRIEDVETVIKNCDLILKVKPNHLVADGVYIDCSTYFCEVTDCLKGDYSTNADGMVLIRTFRDALDSGDEVIIALSEKGQDFSYDQASPICIFTENDVGIEVQIDLWLSETE